MRSKLNYRVRNNQTGQTCGHHHHTRKKALGCLDSLGWNRMDCIVEVFCDKEERKPSMHHNRKMKGLREEEYRED